MSVLWQMLADVGALSKIITVPSGRVLWQPSSDQSLRARARVSQQTSTLCQASKADWTLSGTSWRRFKLQNRHLLLGKAVIPLTRAIRERIRAAYDDALYKSMFTLLLYFFMGSETYL